MRTDSVRRPISRVPGHAFALDRTSIPGRYHGAFWIRSKGLSVMAGRQGSRDPMS